MKNLIICLLALFLTSCVTEKKRLQICNTCAVKTEVRDSIYQVECWDTVRLAPISGPVIYIQDPCDSLGNLNPISITKTKNGVIGTVKSMGNTIVFNCETDSLRAYIRMLKEKYVLNKKIVADVKYIPCKNERTSFDGFTRWWFWGTFVIVLFFVARWILKRYFPLLIFGK